MGETAPNVRLYAENANFSMLAGEARIDNRLVKDGWTSTFAISAFMNNEGSHP